jgi:hypothetical protein
LKASPVASRSGGKKRDLTLDAIIVAAAESVAPAALLTGDPADLRLLAYGLDIRVIAIDTL